MIRVAVFAAGVAVAASSSGDVRQAAPTPRADQLPLRIEVVDYPRPVAAAVRQLERHFGRVVTYEDVSYVAPGDVVDVTEQVRRDGDFSKRVLSMRGESIGVVVRPTDAPVDAQVGDALAEILAGWNGHGRSAEFRLQSVAGGHHVIPVARKGRSGSEPYTSPLDVRITIPYEERDELETLLILTTAISNSAHRAVTPGTMPLVRSE